MLSVHICPAAPLRRLASAGDKRLNGAQQRLCGSDRRMVFTAFDVGVAVLVLISAILATARGFTREILSLATWAGSAAIAAYMYFYHPDIARELHRRADRRRRRDGGRQLHRRADRPASHHHGIADFVVDSRVGPLDRTLGFVFGAARGVLICVVVAVFAQLAARRRPSCPAWCRGQSRCRCCSSRRQLIAAAAADDLEKQVTDFLAARRDDRRHARRDAGADDDHRRPTTTPTPTRRAARAATPPMRAVDQR